MTDAEGARDLMVLERAEAEVKAEGRRELEIVTYMASEFVPVVSVLGIAWCVVCLFVCGGVYPLFSHNFSFRCSITESFPCSSTNFVRCCWVTRRMLRSGCCTHSRDVL